MPQARVRVLNVQALHGPVHTEYLVNGEQQEPMQFVTLSTLSPWEASLCEQAGKTGQLVDIGWREHPRGPRIVSVALLEAAS